MVVCGVGEGGPSKYDRESEGLGKKDEYMDDLNFLEEVVWPDIQHKQLSHDSYCCDRFPRNPSQPKEAAPACRTGLLHSDEPRLLDIDGFIRGVPIPGM